MAKKTAAKKAVQQAVEQPPVEESDKDSLSDETENGDGPTLVTTGFLKCDGIKYQPGEKFPIDHPEAERLFELGVVKEG